MGEHVERGKGGLGLVARVLIYLLKLRDRNSQDDENE